MASKEPKGEQSSPCFKNTRLNEAGSPGPVQVFKASHPLLSLSLLKAMASCGRFLGGLCWPWAQSSTDLTGLALKWPRQHSGFFIGGASGSHSNPNSGQHWSCLGRLLHEPSETKVKWSPSTSCLLPLCCVRGKRNVNLNLHLHSHGTERSCNNPSHTRNKADCLLFNRVGREFRSVGRALAQYGQFRCNSQYQVNLSKVVVPVTPALWRQEQEG